MLVSQIMAISLRKPLRDGAFGGMKLRVSIALILLEVRIGFFVNSLIPGLPIHLFPLRLLKTFSLASTRGQKDLLGKA